MSTDDQAPTSDSSVREPSAGKSSSLSSSALPAGTLLERLEAMAAASEPGPELQGLQLEWSDMQGLFGGTTLQVTGDGTTLVVINGPGTSETKSGTTSPRHVHALLRDLRQLGVFTATSSVRPGVPDEVRLRVSVALGDEKLEIWRWQSDLSPGENDPIGESKALFHETISADSR